MTTSEVQLWRISIPVLATAEDVDALTDRLVATLCPDADHDGPCPIPWALAVTDGGSLSKRKQRRLREEIATTNQG